MTKSTLPVVFTLALLLGGCGADVAALQDPPTFTAASGPSLVVSFGARDTAKCPASAPMFVSIKSTDAGYGADVRLAPGKDGVVYFVLPRGQGFTNQAPIDVDRYYRIGTYTTPAGGLKKDTPVEVKLDEGVVYETVLPRFNMTSCTRALAMKTLPTAASPAPELVTI